MSEAALTVDTGAASGEGNAEAAPPPDEFNENESFDEGEEGEEGEEEEGGEWEEASSFTGASDAEEEARYANEPGCGLSPRIVLKRGCETLQAQDELKPTGPRLTRTDTVAGFESVVGRVGADGLVPAPSAPPLSRVETMSGLPEVRQAFDALDDEAAAQTSASASASGEERPEATPAVVRRVDTMELLQDLDAPNDEPDARPPAKRQAVA